jgi:hypothetical protein
VTSITVHFFGDIDGVVDSALTVDNGVVAVNGVADENRIDILTDGTVRAEPLAFNYNRVKASAAREGKEYYNHTQCQDESRIFRG